MYVCMHVCMYVCMYVCVYIYIYTCMYVCMYVCMHACMYVCTYVRTYVCMYVHTVYMIHTTDTQQATCNVHLPRHGVARHRVSRCRKLALTPRAGQGEGEGEMASSRGQKGSEEARAPALTGFQTGVRANIVCCKSATDTRRSERVAE